MVDHLITSYSKRLVDPNTEEPCERIRVLHVDDEPNYRLLSKRLLEDADPSLEVVSTGSPIEGLGLLGQRVFDCVISDYKMPEYDGIEFARRVRKFSDIPFILYTGQGSEEVAEAAFSAGVDDYLRKEYDPSHYQVLAKRIKTAVDKHMAEEMRRQNEVYLRQIMNSIPVGLIIVDYETHEILDVNPSAIESIGVQRELIIGKICHEYVCPAEEGRCPISDLGQNVDKSERVLLNNEGKKVRIMKTVTPSVMAGRRCLIEAFMDITEQKRMEEELQESLKTSANIVEAIPSGLLIYQFAPPDRLLLVDGNPEAERLTSLKIDEWRGKEFSEIWPYDREVGLKERYLKILETGETLRLDRVYWDDEKTKGFFKIHTFRIPGDRIAVAFENITDRVRYEERLTMLHSHASELASAAGFDEVREMTLDVMEATLGFKYISFLVRRDGHLIATGSRGLPPLKKPLPLDGRGITVKAANERRSILLNDLRGNLNFVRGPLDALSELAVPVIAHDEAAAVLNVESDELGVFTEHDQRLLEILAMHMSSAIMRLREKARADGLLDEVHTCP